MRTIFTYSATWTPGLHLGAARLAVLNWLSAKRCGGESVISCNDINREGNHLDQYSPYNMIQWLGLYFTEGVYYYNHYKWHYDKTLHDLLDCKYAYLDYARPGEMHIEQEAARKEDKSFIYSRKFMAETPKEIKKFEEEGRQACVRLKMPRTYATDGTFIPRECILRECERAKYPAEVKVESWQCVVDDPLFGRQIIHMEDEHDWVIRRTNGQYTAMFMEVVEYNLHAITHAFVEQSHRRVLPAQIFIAKRTQSELPKFIHIPHLAGPMGNKRFSLRHFDKYDRDCEFSELVEDMMRVTEGLPQYKDLGPFYPCYLYFFKRSGFLPEAVRHYLIETIFNEGAEIDSKALSTPIRASLFRFNDITPTPISFDSERILALQQAYMEMCDPKDKAKLLYSFVENLEPRKNCKDKTGLDGEPSAKFVTYAWDNDGDFLVGADIMHHLDSLEFLWE